MVGGRPNQQPKAGYEYLAAYMLGKVIQDLTEQFTKRWIHTYRRRDQMNEAARSNSQNVAEGYTGESLKSYIKLAGVAHGSNEELTKDYEDFLRVNGYSTWGTSHPKIRGFRKFRVCWVCENALNTPKLPNDPEEAANMLLTFCNMDGYLLKRLVDSLKQKHQQEGGLTEELYRNRKEYRGY